MDALIQIQGGPYTAWSGNLTATGTVTINQPNLWGGEKAEGGIVGGIDIFFGDADQPAITYSTPGGDVKFELLELIEGRLYGDSEALNRITSTDGSAHRGKVIAIFKGGRYGANNPYPKPISFLSTRILKGWDDDDCWYPEKAVIPLSGVAGVDFIIDDTALPCPNASSGTQTYTFSGVTPSDVIVFYKAAGGAYGGWSAWGTDDPALEHPTPPVPGSVWFNTFTVTGVVVDSVGAGGPWSYTSPYYSSEADAAAGAIAAGELLRVTGYSEYNITIADSNPADDRGGLSVSVGITAADINAMNPAHIIYESLTAFDMGAEPTANINDASFRAAADQLYSEGFGLCTLYDPAAETIEQFRARICNTAGVSITRSPIDGLWYLDMLRGGGDPSLLPVLTDDDILDYVEDRVSLDDVVNQVAVQWFDPIMKQQRTTAPVQAIGAIDSFQVINAQTTEYLEIPTEPLALRAAARDLGTLSLPLTRLTFTTNRKPYGWRSGTYFVLDAPKRGIASEVFLIGDINRGTLKSGAIQMKAIQDNYSLPLTTFVSSEIGNVQSLQPARPVPVTLQVAMEVPYAFLVSSLTASQLSGLDPDSGYLGVIGVRPIAGSAGFDLETGVGGAYSDVGNGQWCPSTTIPASAGIGDTALIIAGNTDLTFVQTGAAALWDAEIVRIDAIDLIGGTCTVGRGCADTISQIHGATSRIYFCGGTLASDKVEYMSGEVVNAKLLTRTNAGILPDSAATPVSVTMAGRQALPYPPAMIKINGVRWDQVTTLSGTFTVTWAERNRLSQADQLVDQTAATITPETNTRYFLAFYDATNTLLVSRNDIGGTTASVVLNSSGAVTMKMHAINDNGASFQEYAIPLAYSPGPGGGLASAIIAGSDPAQGLFVIVVVGSGPSYTYYDSPDALTWTARITNDVSLDFAALAVLAEVRLGHVVQGYPLPNALQDAEREATRALEIDPSLPVAQQGLGTINAFRGNWREADTRFKAALTDDPSDASGPINYTIYVLESVGHLQQALEQTEEAYRLAPALPRSSIILAANYSITGRDGDALKYIDTAVKLGVGSDVVPVPQIYANAFCAQWTLCRGRGSHRGQLVAGHSGSRRGGCDTRGLCGAG
ncbi:MAG: tetratricopeptide repeat protein [Steroidobacteraceae bacterium]